MPRYGGIGRLCFLAPDAIPFHNPHNPRCSAIARAAAWKELRMQKQSAISDLPLMVPVRQAARKIGISHKTIRKYPQHFFEVLQLGSHCYVRRSDLEAWVEHMADTCSIGRAYSKDGDGIRAPA
jgi:hypothetical protein